MRVKNNVNYAPEGWIVKVVRGGSQGVTSRRRIDICGRLSLDVLSRRAGAKTMNSITRRVG